MELGRSLPTKRKTLSEGIQDMEIKRSGSQPSGKGPTEYFTGTVRIAPLFQANAPACALSASVTFEPGHVHQPFGISRKWFPRPRFRRGRRRIPRPTIKSPKAKRAWRPTGRLFLRLVTPRGKMRVSSLAPGSKKNPAKVAHRCRLQLHGRSQRKDREMTPRPSPSRIRPPFAMRFVRVELSRTSRRAVL